jgi:hypothetical protein
MEAGSGIRLSVVLMLSVVAIVAAQTPKDESADATAFSAIVEHEVSQLNQGITLARWMDAEGNLEDWRKTPEKEIRTDGRASSGMSKLREAREAALRHRNGPGRLLLSSSAAISGNLPHPERSGTDQDLCPRRHSGGSGCASSGKSPYTGPGRAAAPHETIRRKCRDEERRLLGALT